MQSLNRAIVAAAPPLLDSASDASTDSADSAPLLSHGGFELGLTGCGDEWLPSGATVSFDPSARTGQRSCRVCRANSAAFGVIASVLNPAPGHYTLQGHQQVAPDASPRHAYIQLRATLDDGGESLSDDETVPASAWSIARVGLDVPPATRRLAAYVGGKPLGGLGSAPQCILWDDVSLTGP